VGEEGIVLHLGLTDVGDVGPIGVIPLEGRLLVVRRTTLRLTATKSHLHRSHACGASEQDRTCTNTPQTHMGVALCDTYQSFGGDLGIDSAKRGADLLL
jgi:hypothetical protein